MKKQIFYEEAERLYTVEFQTIDYIAKKLGLAEKTVRNWKKEGNWDEKRNANKTAERFADSDALKIKIAELSKRDNLSPADAKTLERLTKALERMQRLETKKAISEKRLKVKETKVSKSIIDRLYDRVLSDEYGLFPYQKEFIRDTSRFRAVLKSRQIGFSYVMALDALLNALKGLDSVIVSASQDQSDILIDYAYRHAEKLGIELISASRSEIITPTGKRIVARPCNFRTVQGFSGSLYLDEFAWVMDAERIWQVAVPVITAVKGRLTVCSTPYEKGNMFWKIMTGEDGRFEQFSKQTISIYDAVAQGLDVNIEEIRGLFDEDSFQRLYNCQWFDDEESYFTFDEIHKCAVPDCLNFFTDGYVYAGYDVGRFTDSSELILVEDGIYNDENKVIVRYMSSLKRTSFDDQKEFLRKILRQYKVKKLRIDATGMGMNLAEDLRREFPHLIEAYWFTRELKEEMAVNLKKLFEDKRIIIPNDSNLIAQIHSIKRTPKSQGFSYDSKRNAEIGHADKFWALAMACMGLGFVKNQGFYIRIY